MSAITKLSDKFQISIPKEIRESQSWQAGQHFAFVPQGGGVLLVPVPDRKALFGLARGVDTTVAYRDRSDRT